MSDILAFGAEYLEAVESPVHGGKTPTVGEISQNLRLLDCLYYSNGSPSCLNDYNGY